MRIGEFEQFLHACCAPAGITTIEPTEALKTSPSMLKVTVPSRM